MTKGYPESSLTLLSFLKIGYTLWERIGTHMAFRRKDLLGLRGIRRDEIEHILDTAVQMKMRRRPSM